LNYKGVAFRAHHPKWAWDPVSGDGARITGGRFNRVGLSALYLTPKLETAIQECKQGLHGRMPPLTVVEYDVDVTPVADLTLPDNTLKLSTWPLELDCPWLELHLNGQPVPTWDLSDELIRRGFAGAIVPSFALLGEKNLVLWSWSDDLPSRVVAFDHEGRLKAMAPRTSVR
jgi:RES domain-containing protein